MLVKTEAKRKKDNGDWNKIKYVRVKKQIKKKNRAREVWHRSLLDYVNKPENEVVNSLIKDKFLFDWKGRRCQHCKKGVCGSKKMVKGRGLRWRCRSYLCQKFTHPAFKHPIFSLGSGTGAMPLAQQAASLMCAVAGVGIAETHILLKTNDKAVRSVSHNLDFARKRHVVQPEKNIIFGNGKAWKDAEADEAVFRKNIVEVKGEKKAEWVQRAGLVERGRPESLVLWKTHSSRTVTRAPGPGAIKKTDWKPVADSRLKNRRVILHTDSARSYRMKVDGMLHDAVVHCKKTVVINGKTVIKKPQYVTLKVHTLKDGTKIKCKGGTQIIDRTWRSIREHIGSCPYAPNSPALTARSRSAQWAYWHRGEDLWEATGNMLYEQMDYMYPNVK